jgi:hypothetical protein
MKHLSCECWGYRRVRFEPRELPVPPRLTRSEIPGHGFARAGSSGAGAVQRRGPGDDGSWLGHQILRQSAREGMECAWLRGLTPTSTGRSRAIALAMTGTKPRPSASCLPNLLTTSKVGAVEPVQRRRHRGLQHPGIEPATARLRSAILADAQHRAIGQHMHVHVASRSVGALGI